MAKLTIDDVLIEAKQGQTIIEAAFEHGIDIPHFCWHPELSVSGNCRMCLVEVGNQKKSPEGNPVFDENGKPVVAYFPKMQIACSTLVTDGMYVRTKSAAVAQTQEAIMEFILINHPLDCPICDEAGQCKLQEYAFRHSDGESRFVEEKNHGKKNQKWGKHVIYDAERCITCSRCIRFTKEYAGQDVLTFVNRGDHVTIEQFEGKELDNDYSMNIIDICPVGALTSSDFRFKARVWDMSFNDSICTGCSRGCNIKLGIRNNEVLRVEPMSNFYVNKYWMCDYGRLNLYEKINNYRLIEPLVKRNNKIEATSFEEAIDSTISVLKSYKASEIFILASPHCSNEDNFAMKKFAKEAFGINEIYFVEIEDSSFADSHLKTAQLSANSAGLKALGIKTFDGGYKAIAEKIKSGKIKALYSLDDTILDNPEITEALSSLAFFAIHAKNKSENLKFANVVFPQAAIAESEGTLTNFESRVQHFAPALTTKGNLRFMGMKQSRLDKFGAPNDRWTQHEYRDVKNGWLIFQKLTEKAGVNWSFKNSSDVFGAICLEFDGFKGMDYKLIKEYQGLTLGKASMPDKKIESYESHYLKPE